MTGIDHRLPPIMAQRSKAFDKKISFHDKLADLGMQLRQLRVAVLLTCAVLLVEQSGELLDSLALPRRNLRRMQAVPGRKLDHRLVALDRFQRHLGLRLSRKPSPRPHGGSSSSMNLP